MNVHSSSDTTASPRQVAADLFGLRGKSVLVTGASQGIGQIVAAQCAAAGATIVLCGRNLDRLGATLASLPGEGHRILPAELTDMAEVKKLAADCGPLDGVVHSAGIRGLSPMKMVNEAHLNEVMSTNYIAPMMLTRHLLARQALRAGSSIVFLSSIAALTGTIGVGPYAGSKAALIGTMRPLALELARRGSRVNSLCPGLVETSLTTEDREWFEEMRKRYPLGIGQPVDVARACLFLLSDASRKITGVSFTMDGGVEFV